MIAQSGRAALVSIGDAAGSTPREAGARMVVRPDGAFAGTIGGGTLEWQALADAQRLLSRETTSGETRMHALGPDLGQCCGGRVTVRIETFDAVDRAMVQDFADAERLGAVMTVGVPAPDGRLVRHRFQDEPVPPGAIVETFGERPTPLHLFGAGHVGRALVQALAPLPFAVTWVDDRPGAIPDRVPFNVAPVTSNPLAALRGAPAGALVAVMTHSHALDLDLVAAALSRDDMSYVGLIGSDTKRARFVSALRKLGIAADRLVCPIGGKALADKSPAVIAAQVVVELLKRREMVQSRTIPALAGGRGYEPLHPRKKAP
jgi:xanthine dehydrogenase accessory factor